ncbi:MAG TPA: hypothetical protein ENN21_02755 [Spirochaetes bacterium]|nr:hypothetical protein [Spirochaetota bacterium]
MSIYESRFWLKFYDEGVPRDVAVPEEPVRHFFNQHVERFPEKTYLYFRDAQFSYAEVNDRACRLANGLTGLGAKKGDRVAFLMPNIPQHVVAIQAGYKAGTVNVGLNPLYTVPELKQQVNDCDARIMIVLSLFAEKAFALLRDPGCSLATVVVANPQGAEKVTADGQVYDFDDLVRGSSAAEPDVEILADDVAMLQYTGGTTGVSKGCCLTNRNITAMCRQHGLWIGNALPPEEMKNLCVIPLFHVYGWNTNVNMTMLGGGSIVLVPIPDPNLILQNINQHEPTVWCTVPQLINALIHHPETASSKLKNIRGFFSGSAPLPVEEIKRLKELSGAAVMEGYGSSETTNIITINPINRTKPGSVGVPIPNTIIKIMDVKTGEKEMPLGEPGEIVAKGPQIMKEYWQNPKETKIVFNEEGYLLTGDIGYMDEDGYIFIIDRKKDMIIRGGFNVYPRDIDEVIYQLPQVKEACTIGIPHPKSGETVKVFVILKEGGSLTAEEIEKHCRTQLAPYKVPEFIEFVDEIPKTGIGKYDRKVLKARERANALG